TKSEGREANTKKSGPRANPNPRRIVRHEGSRNHADALEGPDDTGEGDQDPEDDRDHAHGQATRRRPLSLGPCRVDPAPTLAGLSRRSSRGLRAHANSGTIPRSH